MEFNLEDKFINYTEPVSPLGQTFSTSLLSVCVQAIFELERPMDVCSAKKAIRDILLPSNPRFCCLMTEDTNGVLRWEKTEVNVDDHVIVPEFRAGQNDYDEFVNDYICNIHLTPLQKCRPLWEFHFLNYNTSNARATLIINMHHSLGDGTSLMALVFGCVTRADNPNLRLTFPSSTSLPKKTSSLYCSWAFSEFFYGMLHRLFMLVLVMLYTVSDFIVSLLRMGWMEDSKTPIRGPPGVELLPKVMSSVIFPIEEIRKIKDSVGGTVNDVVMGIIFYGLQQYLKNALPLGYKIAPVEHKAAPNELKMSNLRVTGLVTMNTRAISGQKSIEEMLKPNSETPWGNRFGLLQIPIPMTDMKNPVDYVRKAKQIIDRKKLSVEVFVTSRLLGFVGRQASAACFYKTLANTTLVISNMVGPKEKVAMNRIPIKSFYFSISGLPQTLLLTVVSYMGSVRIEVIGAKGYVDSETLAKHFGESFEEMRDISIARRR
ncbi:hypothetical protein KI387_027522 [Taxus chinensis]|uniref:Diacylglycerol O-acyltransferase n=1 Tax=Taxus chinensis TaxID=29808 RepID=A0AA38L9L2_TAXCH|nr:hypothetical protein KI387_027522 [Taxus chinensis]